MDSELKVLYNEIDNDFNRCISFWINNSIDTDHGGFFNCLDKTGKVYDNKKYVWLQGRQVWMLATIYNSESNYKTPELKEALLNAARFLMTKCRDSETGRCYFCVSRDGTPVSMQRKIFSECFYAMAMCAMYNITNEDIYKNEVFSILKLLLHWTTVSDSDLGLQKFSGAPPHSSLAVPMMMLFVMRELFIICPEIKETYRTLCYEWMDECYSHVQRNGTEVFEMVTLDGHEINSVEGRVVNPGHVIECGWLLLEIRKIFPEHKGMQESEIINSFITEAFKRGWMEECGGGGIVAFRDADGGDPLQLEWGMKLFWPHCEALIAMLTAYKINKNTTFIDCFKEVWQFSKTKLCDEVNGEWYGYLNYDNTISKHWKGGPYKGCFHVPRALMMCRSMLSELLTDN